MRRGASRARLIKSETGGPMASNEREQNDKVDEVLQRVDPAKRGFLKALVVGSAFVAPTVASFSMEGLSVYEAHAQGGSNIAPSDRNVKEGFAPVDARMILDRVAGLPIETWRYKGDGIRHIGPMAQDFAAAFNVGPDDRHIDLIDASGVALAAIQALVQRVETQDIELTAVKAALARLQAGTST
jgi:endosialidase-like protein